MVLGTPTTRSPFFASALRDGQRAVAADGDQASMPLPAERRDQLVRAVDLDDRARRACFTGKRSGLPRFVVPRIVPPRWVMPRTRSRVRGISPPSGYSLGQQQAVVAVADADALPAAVEAREHDGADDGVQPRRVAAPGRHGDPSYGHVPSPVMSSGGFRRSGD